MRRAAALLAALALPEGHRYLVADGDGGLHSVSVQGAGLFVLPLDGGS